MKVTRLTYVITALVMLMALGVNVRSTAAAPLQQTGPTTWTVLVGAEAELQPVEHGQAGAWQIMKFYPDNLTINAGDTIDFKLNSTEVHNVLFLAPGEKAPDTIIVQPNPNGPPSFFANLAVDAPSGGPNFDGTAQAGSGQMGGPPTNPREYKLTFTKAGSFDYLCSYHSFAGPDGKLMGMLGKVVVQDANTAYPKTADQVNTDAAAAIATDQAEVVKGEPAVQQLAQASRPGPNGTTIYQVNVGGQNMNPMGDYMRFYPSELTVHEGDTVEWVWHGFPHNVLLASGGKEPDLVLVQPQPGGPPKVQFNPAVMLPNGGNSYNGMGVVNSGVMQPDTQGNYAHTFTLTFTKAGKYEYICTFHDQVGMTGHITVTAAAMGSGNSTTTQPTMPHTGSSDNLLMWLLVIALGLVALGLTVRRTLVLARR